MSQGAVLPSFGRFQAIEVVRRDGATTHYTARDPELDRQVALVTAPAGPDAAEADRLAFRLPRMRHPNIVSVLDAGLQDDVAYVAAECLQTEPLSAFLARPGRMPFFQGLPLVLQLLSAIEHAQARRLVHAGIDTEHVQVTPGGQPKLPAAGWSLSADRQPNLEDAARVARIVLWRSCPPALRSAVDQVLQRAEAPDPAARYQRAEEFILALLAAAGYPVPCTGAAVDRRAAAQPQRVERVAPVERPAAAMPLQRIEPAATVERPAAAEPQRAEPVAAMERATAAMPLERGEPVAAMERPAAAEPQRVEPVATMERPTATMPERVEAVATMERAAAAEPQGVEPVATMERPTAAVPPERVEPVLLAERIQPVEPVLLAERVEPVLRAEPVVPAPAAHPVATRAVRHAPHKPLRRHRTGRHLLAACLLASLLLPRWVGERVFDGKEGTATAQGTVALGAPPANATAATLAQAAAPNGPGAPAPVAPAAATPATVALASLTAPPVHTPVVPPPPVETPAVQPAPVEEAPVAQPAPAETSAVQPAPAETPAVAPSRVARSPAAPSPAARLPAHALAVAPRLPAPKPVVRPAVRQQAAHARTFASAEAVRAKPATTRARTARPHPARVVTAASGCPYDVPVFRELCEARRCSRPELRHDPACMRMQAEQRAALARLRGTPD